MEHYYGPMVRRRAKTNWEHIFFRKQFKFSFCRDGTPGGGAATLGLNYRTKVTAADMFLVMLVLLSTPSTQHPAKEESPVKPNLYLQIEQRKYIKKWFSICCIVVWNAPWLVNVDVDLPLTLFLQRVIALDSPWAGHRAVEVATYRRTMKTGSSGTAVVTRAGNESSRRFHNHGTLQGPSPGWKGILAYKI